MKSEAPSMLKKTVSSRATLPMRDIKKVWLPRSQKVQYNKMSKKIFHFELQGGSNMTGTDLCVNKPHCAAAVRP
jgi:hypothetical protein